MKKNYAKIKKIGEKSGNYAENFYEKTTHFEIK